MRSRSSTAMILLAGATLALGAGCSNPDPYKGFIQHTDTFAFQTGGVDLERYYHADATLTPEQLADRLGELDAFRQTTRAAMQAAGLSPPGQ